MVFAVLLLLEPSISLAVGTCDNKLKGIKYFRQHKYIKSHLITVQWSQKLNLWFVKMI